jgi:hypothetical protein
MNPTCARTYFALPDRPGHEKLGRGWHWPRDLAHTPAGEAGVYPVHATLSRFSRPPEADGHPIARLASRPRAFDREPPCGCGGGGGGGRERVRIGGCSEGGEGASGRRVGPPFAGLSAAIHQDFGGWTYFITATLEIAILRLHSCRCTARDLFCICAFFLSLSHSL